MKEEFKGYIKYFGPLTEDGSLDIAKAGKSMTSLDRFLKKYQHDVLGLDKEGQYILKISEINNNCSELIFIVTEVVKSTPVDILFAGIGLNQLGVGEFGKQFFGTLGQQLALKIFSRGKSTKKNREFIDGDKVLIELINSDQEKKIVTLKAWENFIKLAPYLDGFVQLEKGKEEEMRIGYRDNSRDNQVAIIKYEEKDYFGIPEGLPVEERMNEPFDESNATQETIVGRFIDFYGLAHKYHFAFQARKKQDEIGKQKILCIVPESQTSQILDYLKPEFEKNVCISGKATRDWEGRVDKIRIDWVSENENHNPDQGTIV